MRGWLFGAVLVFTLGVIAFAQMSGSDEEIAGSVWDTIHNQAYEFTWHYEPGAPPGFYTGNAPHGAVLRTFYNNIAYDATQNRTGSFPAGSILVKENHISGHSEDGGSGGAAESGNSDEKVLLEDFEPNLEAITVMVKLAGYNPEAGDWFWAKYQPDGSLDAVGKPAGCIGCHGQVADNDWVFDAVVTSE